MKVYFITFGNEPWHASVQCLCEEARESGVFDVVRGYTESDLDEWTRTYCDNNPRGYGFWMWKSYVCLKTLEEADENDVIIYADAGCVLNPPAKQRLYEYIDMVTKSPYGIIGFQMTHLERHWTKRELLHKFGCDNRSDILDSGQIEATAFVFRKCPHATNIIREWNSIPKQDPFYINTTTVVQQHEGFREHRHDQSVFSLLLKTRGAVVLGWETWCWSEHESQDAMNPIWEKRRKLAPLKVHNPNTLSALKICDVVYNDKNEYIILAEESNANRDVEIHLKTVDGLKLFTTTRDPHGMVTVYICPHDERMPEIVVRANNVEYTLKVSVFPSFANQTILSTLVWNEDDYIPQWIEYHKALGVDRFVIYDNVPGATRVEQTLKQYIRDGIVLVIKWPFKWGRPNGEAAQQTQQNHTLYSFQHAKWIGFLDIDEYVNPQTESICIPDVLDSIVKTASLRYDDIAGVRLVSRHFFNSNNQKESGYDFLSIHTCGEIIHDSRWKYFVNPRNVYMFSVHQVSLGLPSCFASSEALYFNHYMFLNKTTSSNGNYNHGRGPGSQYRNVRSPCVDTSIQRILDRIHVRKNT